MTEFTFIVGYDKYKFSAETAAKAMELCNRQVIDKQNLHPMSWFHHGEASENTFLCCSGNFYS